MIIAPASGPLPIQPRGSPLPIVLGMVMDLHAAGPDPVLLINWWLPQMAFENTMQRGRRREVVDLFGTWTPADSRELSEHVGTTLPSPLLSMSLILEFNVDMDSGLVYHAIPYGVLDKLQNRHGIDLTGLSVSRTANGGLYRAYRLSR